MLNRLVWIAMFLGIAFMAVRFGEGLLVNAGSLTVSTQGVPSNTVVLEWRGEVSPPMVSELRKAYREWGPKKERFILSLHSPGGLLGYGDKVIGLLQQMARTHQLDTVVERRKTCGSMCVPIFLQGETRSAAANSRWLFHEPIAVDIVTDEHLPSSREETDVKTQQFLRRYFTPAGVPRQWLRDTREKMRGRDYWRSGRQLVDERAGIVQRLL